MIGQSGQSARARILDAAVELFATKGYEATSVADIQLACGLTAGSGALYKHFPSKRALLEEVVQLHLADIASTRAVVVSEMLARFDLGSDDLETIMRLGARLTWQSMEQNRAVIRLTVRDLEPYPELLHEVWDAVGKDVYRQAAELIEIVMASGAIDVADPEATAAVLVASLTYLPILQGLIGRTPGDIDPERYLDAWVDHALKTLRAPSQARAD